jgi:hypothetical protein
MNVELLDPARIAEFRSNTAAKRLIFQKAVQDLIHEFAGLSGEGQIKKLTDRLVDIAKERIAHTQQSYRLARLEYVTKTMGLTLGPPAIAGSVASMLNIGIFVPAGIAAAVALCAAQFLISKEKADLDRQKSPWAYVLSLASLK